MINEEVKEILEFIGNYKSNQVKIIGYDKWEEEIDENFKEMIMDNQNISEDEFNHDFEKYLEEYNEAAFGRIDASLSDYDMIGDSITDHISDLLLTIDNNKPAKLKLELPNGEEYIIFE